MAELGLSRLSDGQRACLRMVLQHMSSKDIARELKISPHTVDQRIRIAMGHLGATSRVEAAKLLAAHENTDPYQSFIYQPPDIVDAAPIPRRFHREVQRYQAKCIWRLFPFSSSMA